MFFAICSHLSMVFPLVYEFPRVCPGKLGKIRMTPFSMVSSMVFLWFPYVFFRSLGGQLTNSSRLLGLAAGTLADPNGPRFLG